MRCNLNKCEESVKSAAYLGLICPKLEYASAVWDSHLSKDVNAIERVQRIAARWAKFIEEWEDIKTVHNTDRLTSALLTSVLFDA